MLPTIAQLTEEKQYRIRTALKLMNLNDGFSYRLAAEAGYEVGVKMERERYDRVRREIKKHLENRTLAQWMLYNLGFAVDGTGVWYHDEFGSTHFKVWPWKKPVKSVTAKQEETTT